MIRTDITKINIIVFGIKHMPKVLQTFGPNTKIAIFLPSTVIYTVQGMCMHKHTGDRCLQPPYEFEQQTA